MTILAVVAPASAIPSVGMISFEEAFGVDGAPFASWNTVTTQYSDGYGVVFSPIGPNAAAPTIFDGVLPSYYPPRSGTRILSNWSNYGRSAPAGCLEIRFDTSPTGFGSGLSVVSGWVTVASNSADAEAFLTVEAFGVSGMVVDAATVWRNLGSSDYFELRGDFDIASVIFTHSEGPTDYHWALDDLGYAVVPEPASAALVAIGWIGLIRLRGGPGHCSRPVVQPEVRA